MKKIIYTLIISFSFALLTCAETISLDNYLKTVESGTVTSELQKKYSNCDIQIKTSNNSTYFSIIYNFTCQEEDDQGKEISSIYQGQVEGSYNSEESKLTIDREISAEDADLDPYYNVILKYLPYWAIESSASFSEIESKLTDKDMLTTFEEVLPTCELEETGYCYTETNNSGNISYKSELLLDDKIGTYTLDNLQHNGVTSIIKTIFIVIITIIVLFIILVFAIRLIKKQKRRREVRK